MLTKLSGHIISARLLPRAFRASALALLCAVTPTRAQTGLGRSIAITVTHDAAQPLAGAAVQLRSDDSTVLGNFTTDSRGRALVRCSTPSGTCILTITAPGYLPLRGTIQAGSSGYELQLAHLPTANESVTVQANDTSPLATQQSGVNTVPVTDANLSALRPATLADALPLVPGVVRTPDGQININGLSEFHSAMIVNNVVVSDPATGSFGLSVPIDSVETAKVLESPFLAQYGDFTAGVVSAETRRGTDRLDYSLNDPLPEFRFRSGHLVGFATATPRLNVSGPLIPNHLYAFVANEYILRKQEVRTLPYPVDYTTVNAFNSFTELDAPLTATQTLTATLHLAPEHIQYAGLNYFDPEPVTPDTRFQETVATLTHRAGIGRALLTSTVAFNRYGRTVVPQSEGTMTLAPTGDSGSYFTQQGGNGTRIQWMETWEPGTVVWHGAHTPEAGTVFARATDGGLVVSRPVTLTDSAGRTVQTITYTNAGKYSVADTEPAAWVQDHWIATKAVALDAGLRWERQSAAASNRFAPRAGVTWTPLGERRVILRGGAGVFYDRVPLGVFAFPQFPQQTVTTYDSQGAVIDGPRAFQNILATNGGQSTVAPSSVSFAPRSVTWSAEAEQNLRLLKLRVRYQQSSLQNQLALRSQISATVSALSVEPNGSGAIRQFEFTSGLGKDADRHAYFSYVRQYARGTLTDIATYLGNLRYPVVRTLDQASAPGEVPNRFLLWGTTPLPYRMRISPHIEFRDGFTYQVTDVQQQYVVLPNGTQPRYPRYFSLDARLSKDFDIGRKHAIRLSLNGINLTNHSNFLQVHSNNADPQFGQFFGTYTRHVLLDFDFLH